MMLDKNNNQKYLFFCNELFMALKCGDNSIIGNEVILDFHIAGVQVGYVSIVDNGDSTYSVNVLSDLLKEDEALTLSNALQEIISRANFISADFVFNKIPKSEYESYGFQKSINSRHYFYIADGSILSEELESVYSLAIQFPEHTESLLELFTSTLSSKDYCVSIDEELDIVESKVGSGYKFRIYLSIVKGDEIHDYVIAPSVDFGSSSKPVSMDNIYSIPGTVIKDSKGDKYLVMLSHGNLGVYVSLKNLASDSLFLTGLLDSNSIKETE